MNSIRTMSDLRNKYPEIENFEYEEYVENALDEADKEAKDPNTKYYSHKEFKQIARMIINCKE